MLGLSYSSIDMPRDNRRPPAPSFEPLEPEEKARERSTPGMATDVKRPWPLQNSRIDWATFAGYKIRTEISQIKDSQSFKKG
jgi:hypothetical protein